MILAYFAALAAAPAQCALPPVSLDSSDAAFSRAFAEGSDNNGKLRASLAAGYESACGKGHLKDKPLPALVLLNAPNANIAAIYEADGRRVLEYPFLTEGGVVSVPTPEEIEEAIYCAVVGATEDEQAESGRCLPD